jgi:hypothetical protein
MLVSMQLDELEAVLRTEADEIHGNDGAWELVIEHVTMACLTDAGFDRMRVIAPIVEETDLTDEQLRAVLEANFHTALDARYATSDGVLYAAFIHPLSPLTEEQLRSALSQLVSLVETFGTTYTGGTLVFGNPPVDRGDLN